MSDSQRHPFTVHDLLAMHRVSDPQVSPDGQLVLFDCKVIDLEQNKGVSDLWLVGVDGSGIRRLTSHPAGSTHGRWSADGASVYFLSKRGERRQVWRIAIAGGEAEPVTDEPLDVGCLVVGPKGGHLAYTMEVFPGTTPAETKDRLAEIDKRPATGRRYDRLFIRHWDTWKDGRRSHLFVRPVSAAPGAVDAAVDVMKDVDSDTPSKPFGGAEEIAFTPDERSLVFAMADSGRAEAWSTQYNLYQVPITGAAPPRCITPGNEAWITAPAFSPDGKQLAYLAMARPGYESDRRRIVVRAWPDGEPRVLTEAWDRSALGLAWSRDGRTLYTVADNLGHRSLFAVDASSGAVRTVLAESKAGLPAPATDRLIVPVCHHRSPTELHAVSFDGTSSRPITAVNAQRAAAIDWGMPQQFTFPGGKGETVHAWVVKPAGFAEGTKYPVAFLIHGGPQGSFGNDFHYRWNPQVYAGAGFGVVMVDFHGSTGYGQSFTDAINDDWGGVPFEDLQLGLAAALERYAWLDGERVAALGASFGGYMINWIAGRWPDRFKCLVNHDGNLDERLAYYDTEELWFPEWERGGPPWEQPEAYTKHNPIDHVQHWQTPMLVIHGGQDFRVVDTQGISTFTALQRRGIPSELLYFPDENHWVLKPANSIQWHETVLAWLKRWT